MYYKITNKECEVYKQLHKLRATEKKAEEDNIHAIEAKTGLKWTGFLGHNSQQNIRRVRDYVGFMFSEPDKVDLKIWQKDKTHEGVFVPNKKTKLGREMAQFLLNGLKGSRYDKVFEILKLEHLKRFTFPYVEVVGDVILVFLGDNHEPSDTNLIEITKREFQEITAA